VCKAHEGGVTSKVFKASQPLKALKGHTCRATHTRLELTYNDLQALLRITWGNMILKPNTTRIYRSLSSVRVRIFSEEWQHQSFLSLHARRCELCNGRIHMQYHNEVEVRELEKRKQSNTVAARKESLN
jgi:hypothetical protein